MIVFEQQTYDVSETGNSQEVCVVPSAALEPGQSISGILSTVDDTAIGISNNIVIIKLRNVSGLSINFVYNSMCISVPSQLIESTDSMIV